jgi:hypothetical protein
VLPVGEERGMKGNLIVWEGSLSPDDFDTSLSFFTREQE